MKTLKTFLFCLFLTIAAVAYTEPRYYGIDHLGGARYGDVLVSSHPDGFAVGIFTQKELFGDAYPALDRLLKARRVPLVRYSLRWSDSHSFSRADFPAIIAEARRFVPLVAKYPAVECQFSGATEHQLSRADAFALASQVLAIIPERCVYVNNPWEGKGAFIPPSARIINEVHGTNARRPNVGGKYNFSFDGSSSVDSDVESLKQRLGDSEVFFLWHPANNGKLKADDSTPRPQRNSWPTPALLESLAFLTTPREVTSIPVDWLYKTHADRHMTPPEPRAYKPVIISPVNAPYIEMLAGGKVIAVSSPPQPFVDGRRRYYIPEYGYRVAQKTKRATGSPIVSFRANGKAVGSINPGFRAGLFR